MTNAEAYEALNIASAIPLNLRPGASYTPSLILIRSGLMRVARELEPQRQSIISDAMTAAKAPEDFAGRMLDRDDDKPDPETERILNEVNSHFIPVWSKILKEEAAFRYPLLSPAQFAELYAALTSDDAPASFTVGNRESVSLPELLALVADYLVEPDNTQL